MCIDCCSVDGTEDTGRYGRLINHSRKDPNAECRKVTIGGQLRLIIVAKKDISEGEEILYDYNGT